MRRGLYCVLVVAAAISKSCVSASSRNETHITDANLKIWRNELSPDGKSRIVIYQKDLGALGYSRVSWHVAPAEIDGVNLEEFKLPDGYRAEGWTNENTLQISQWRPPYYLKDYRNLQSGATFNGVRIRLSQNESPVALPGYTEPNVD